MSLADCVALSPKVIGGDEGVGASSGTSCKNGEFFFTYALSSSSVIAHVPCAYCVGCQFGNFLISFLNISGSIHPFFSAVSTAFPSLNPFLLSPNLSIT